MYEAALFDPPNLEFPGWVCRRRRFPKEADPKGPLVANAHAHTVRPAGCIPRDGLSGSDLGDPSLCPTPNSAGRAGFGRSRPIGSDRDLPSRLPCERRSGIFETKPGSKLSAQFWANLWLIGLPAGHGRPSIIDIYPVPLHRQTQCRARASSMDMLRIDGIVMSGHHARDGFFLALPVAPCIHMHAGCGEHIFAERATFWTHTHTHTPHWARNAYPTARRLVRIFRWLWGPRSPGGCHSVVLGDRRQRAGGRGAVRPDALERKAAHTGCERAGARLEEMRDVRRCSFSHASFRCSGGDPTSESSQSDPPRSLNPRQCPQSALGPERTGFLAARRDHWAKFDSASRV